MIKLLFFGSHSVPTPIFKKLLESEAVAPEALVTTPFPKNEKNDIYHIAKKSSSKIYQPRNFADKSKEILGETTPDIGLVCSYGQLLDKQTLNYPKHKCLNIHYSLLPKLRGACPIEMTILKGLRKTGVTIQLMKQKLDAGDILFQKEVKICKYETKKSLTEKLQNVTIDHIEKVLVDWVKGRINPIPQDDSKATYCTKEDVTKEKARLRWKNRVKSIDRKVRTFCPEPGAWCEVLIAGKKQRMKIFDVGICQVDHYHKTGFTETNDGSIKIYAKDGIVLPKDIQLSGKRRMKTSEFIKGLKHKIQFI